MNITFLSNKHKRNKKSTTVSVDTKKTKKIRYSFDFFKGRPVLLYGSIFVMLLSLISVVYYDPSDSSNYTASVSTAEATTKDAEVSDVASLSDISIDDKTATDVAADFAIQAKMPVATNITNLSASLSAQDEMKQSDDSIIVKPKIIQSVSANRDITKYKVKDGETIASIAKAHNISEATLRWANDLKKDQSISAGNTIIIPPVDGVIYTVKDGDTIESIAKRYKSDQARIVAFNDLEVDGLKDGQKIVIPDGKLPNTERPDYVAPVTHTYSAPSYYGSSYAFNFGGAKFLRIDRGPTSPGNKNFRGQCTWFVWEYMKKHGRKLPSAILGNARAWHRTLGSMGYTVNRSPAVGSILQTSAGGGGYGHVAVVIGVGDDGSVTVKEMNVIGPYVVDERTIPASAAKRYNYIH